MKRLHFTCIDTTKAFRPVFLAIVNNKPTTCLLDTGATIPVFSGTPELFNAWFLNTTNLTIIDQINIRGFGGDNCIAALYNLDRFSISDGKSSMHFRDMKIAVAVNKILPAQLLLPSPIFAFTRYCIDTTKIPAQIHIEPTFDNMFIKRSDKGLGIEVYANRV